VEIDMSNGSDAADAARERLSALVDGELEGATVAAACASWREDSASRSTWHAYHLIGDVLRSEDLAASPRRDEAFLISLRARLVIEPVVLAPAVPSSVEIDVRSDVPAEVAIPRRAVAGARGGRWSWMAPSAVAAGFVVVAGAVMVTNAPTPTQRVGAPALAQTAAARMAVLPVVPAASTLKVANTTSSFEPQTLVANGRLIRDPRLDRYLSAHKEFAGSTALGVPSAFLRDAVAEAPGR
jgi:sigma-E factor negative regulatory protein RseA